MFKLVVLSALVAVSMAAPKPGLLHGYSAIAVPTAVSHQSRVDVHHSPVIATSYSAVPLVHSTPVLAAAPLVAAPAVHAYSLPTAVSHQSRVDLHQSAVYAAPLAHGLAYGYAGLPALHGW